MNVKGLLKSGWFKGSVVLGLSFFVSLWLVKPIGVSTQYSVTSGMIHSLVDDALIYEDDTTSTGYNSTNDYYARSDAKLAASIENPLNYNYLFVLAIPLGAFIAHQTVGKKNRDVQKSVVLTLTKKQKLISFISGLLLVFGARLADGCTSGHMMSGMMQSSVSGYVFAAVVFLVAILTAILTKNIFKEGL